MVKHRTPWGYICFPVIYTGKEHTNVQTHMKYIHLLFTYIYLQNYSSFCLEVNVLYISFIFTTYNLIDAKCIHNCPQAIVSRKGNTLSRGRHQFKTLLFTYNFS